jgi:DNA-binding LytR/AlgR family response regulator
LIKHAVAYIIISKGTEFLRVPQDKLVYISSEGNYSNVVTVDNRQRLVTFQLGQLEGMIGEQLGEKGSHFLRIGRSLIINIDYIYLIDVSKQQLALSDCSGCYHELSASREVLIKLKAYMESLSIKQNG